MSRILHCKCTHATALQLLLMPLLVLCLLTQNSVAQLEPGEIVTDQISNTFGTQPAVPAATSHSAPLHRCDVTQSRRARRIVQEWMIDALPDSYSLPLSCPLHPSLDLLSQFDEGTKHKRRIPFGARNDIAAGAWQCAHCSKKFTNDDSINAHLQRSHMTQIGSSVAGSLVCAADYCDVLDCYHRSVQFDPLTGAVMGDGAGGGTLYGSAASRQRRMKLANEARKAERQQQQGSAAASAPSPSALHSLTDSDTGAPLSADHPLSHRCSHNSMAFAKARCEAIMLQCFPFSEQTTAAASKSVHDLYDQFHSIFCAPLRCVEDAESGRLAHANAVDLVDRRSSESRSRMWTVIAVLLIVILGLFYFFVWNLRSEFGWRVNTRVGGGGASALGAAAAKANRQQSRLSAWIGMQGKKKAGKLQ